MSRRILFVFLWVATMASCQDSTRTELEMEAARAAGVMPVEQYLDSLGLQVDTLEVATFSGGNFYALQQVLTQLRGVEVILCGYTGGSTDFPDLSYVQENGGGHRLAIRLYFNPKRISYNMILNVFMRSHDPTQAKGQGPDRGKAYESYIYVHSDDQRMEAEKVIDELAGKSRFAGGIKTKITEPGVFWVAERKQQTYYDDHKDDDPYLSQVVLPVIKEMERSYAAWMVRKKK